MQVSGDLVFSGVRDAGGNSLTIDERFVGVGGMLLEFADTVNIPENVVTTLQVNNVTRDNPNYVVDGTLWLPNSDTFQTTPNNCHRLFSLLVHCSFSYQPQPGFTILTSQSIYQIISAQSPNSSQQFELSLVCNETDTTEAKHIHPIQVGENTSVSSHTVFVPRLKQPTYTLLVSSPLPLTITQLKIWTHFTYQVVSMHSRSKTCS